MANPVLLNVTPAYGSVAKPEAPARYSLRSPALEVVRSTINLYRGAGPSYYEASSGVLPENHEDLAFSLIALEGIRNNPADRSLVDVSGVDYLKIEKTYDPPEYQEALYIFGGLEAPAASDAMLMVEFTLLVNAGDLTPDGDETGILLGLLAGDTGVVVKLREGTRAVEMWSASYAATGRPTPLGDPYRYVYDWDGAATTFKLLWHPRGDSVRLYMQQGTPGDGTTSDELIMDGAISDFPALPAGEVRTNPPWVYFGHTFGTPKGTSYWSNVYLSNLSNTVVYGGVIVGEQEGALLSDEECVYEPEALPTDVQRPWLPLPASFGSLGGSERLDNGQLALHRNDVSESIGFFREETQLGSGVSVFDFTARGEISRVKESTVNTGMEFYIDTGSLMARVALLHDGTNSYVGLYIGGPTSVTSSYLAYLTGWQTERTYRLKMDPTGQTNLYVLAAGEEGVEEVYLAGVSTTALPASEMPGPGIGFLHNANTSEASASLFVRRLRYATRCARVDVYPVPAPWVSDGTGTDSEEDGLITLESTSQGDHFYFYRGEADTDAENGSSVEFRAKVKSYSIDGEESRIRSLTGAGVVVNDGANQLALLFADAGPPHGRIAFLAKTDTDYEGTLKKIRAGDESVDGIFASVDWATSHLYRIQRSVGGKILLFVDNSTTPSLELDEYNYDYPASGTGTWQIRFGNVLAGALVKSQWSMVQYNVSRGLDVSIAQKVGAGEVFQRYAHAFNDVLEMEDSA